MNRSETIGALAKALAAAQAEMHNPQFDSVNPAFKSKFASLASVRNAVVPVLAKNGIALMQDVSIGDYGVSCVTRLFHESGEWMQSMELTVPVAQKSAHGVGSACTYAKRYQLLALACVAGDDDDDANGAVGTSQPAPAKVDAAKALEAAQEAAMQGADAFREFWKRMDNATKAALRPHIPKLEAAAKSADEVTA